MPRCIYKADDCTGCMECEKYRYCKICGAELVYKYPWSRKPTVCLECNADFENTDEYERN